MPPFLLKKAGVCAIYILSRYRFIPVFHKHFHNSQYILCIHCIQPGLQKR